MKINGLNVSDQFEDEPSVETWAKVVMNDPTIRNYPRLARELATTMLEAYMQAENYNGPISKLHTDENGYVILPKGTLLHATKPFINNGNEELDFEKFISIKKFGLISLGMLKGAEDFDDEVPLLVSFHRCSKTQTVLEKINDICDYNNSCYKSIGINMNKISDILLIVDVYNEGIQKLLSFDISNIRENIDLGHSYVTENNKPYAYRLKKYPRGIETEQDKQAIGYLRHEGRPVAQGPDFAYLPISVPSKYIVGIVLPQELEGNREVIDFLSKTFDSATIISSDGKKIEPMESEKDL